MCCFISFTVHYLLTFNEAPGLFNCSYLYSMCMYGLHMFLILTYCDCVHTLATQFYPFPHIFFLLINIFFLWIWRISLSISCRTDLVWIYYVSFCLLGNVLISFAFSRTALLDSVLGFCSFYFSTGKTSSHCLLVYTVTLRRTEMHMCYLICCCCCCVVLGIVFLMFY